MTGLRAGERLDPVAAVMTTRTAFRVLNSDGELVLEIADDQVESGPPDGESTLHSWREVGEHQDAVVEANFLAGLLAA